MSERTHCDRRGCGRVIGDEEPRLEIVPRVVRTAGGIGMGDVGDAVHLCGNCVLSAPGDELRAVLREALGEVSEEVSEMPVVELRGPCLKA